MASRFIGMALVFIAAGFAVAGVTSTHEQLAQKMLASLDKITQVLLTIDGEDVAKDAKPALRKAADSWIEARVQAAKLPPPEREEKERLVKIYRTKIDATLKKMFIEIQRVSVIPGGKDALTEIAGVLKKDEK